MIHFQLLPAMLIGLGVIKTLLFAETEAKSSVSVNPGLGIGLRSHHGVVLKNIPSRPFPMHPALTSLQYLEKRPVKRKAKQTDFRVLKNTLLQETVTSGRP